MTGRRGPSPVCGRGCDRATTSAAIASGSATARCPHVSAGFRVPIAGHAKTSQFPMCTKRMAGAAVTGTAARRAEREALDGKPTSAIAAEG